MAITLLAAVALLLISLKFLVNHLRGVRRSLGYPPGPPTLPILGNLFDFPLSDPGRKYLALGKEHNTDIVHLSVLGNHITVLNKREDADELFERRASKYSDRPVIPIIELMGWQYNIALLAYGKLWRYHRRLMQQSFRHEAVERAYYWIIEEKVHNMLKGLLEMPDDLVRHNKMLSISVPMATMYGYDVKSVDDPAIGAADDCLDQGSRLFLPGENYINLFPVLKHLPVWFPMFKSRAVLDEVKAKTATMKRIPLEFVKECMKAGTHRSSFVVDFFERKNTEGASDQEEDAVLNIAYTAYAGAGDTTISATGTFFYLMGVNPISQKKAQAEIDMVTGSKRLPSFDDRSSMPYVEAVYREVMRWCPPVTIGLPHQTYEEDYYKGYFMPKGMQVYANIWAMTHDPEKYPDPDAFKPERFFNENGTLNDDSRVLAYGFGRRVCAGKYIASAQMWLMMACVLSCFDIGVGKDEHGRDIEIDHDFEDRSFIRYKKPYKSSITPRSRETINLVKAVKSTTI